MKKASLMTWTRQQEAPANIGSGMPEWKQSLKDFIDIGREAPNAPASAAPTALLVLFLFHIANQWLRMCTLILMIQSGG